MVVADVVGELPAAVVVESTGVRGVLVEEARRLELLWEAVVPAVTAVTVIMVAVAAAAATTAVMVGEEVAVAVVAVRVLFQGFPVVMPLMLQEAIRGNRNITADMFLKIPVCRIVRGMETDRYASP